MKTDGGGPGANPTDTLAAPRSARSARRDLRLFFGGQAVSLAGTWMAYRWPRRGSCGG